MKNINQRMREFIKSSLLKEGLDVFGANADDQQSHLIVRTVDENNIPSFTEVQILSRSEEYSIELQFPWDIKKAQNAYCYFILHSAGMNKYWLMRADELIMLRGQGLDDRDTSPYKVTDFQRLKYPALNLQEYQQKFAQ